MEDLIEQANEIQESLGRSYGVPDEIDEDELQAGMVAPEGLLDYIYHSEVTLYFIRRTRRTRDSFRGRNAVISARSQQSTRFH
jgi:hypothetical protein